MHLTGMMEESEENKAYKEAIDFLFGALPMYQRVGKAAYKANLDNSRKLDLYFESPHKNFPTIHVAGTNGKGSVCHMLASVLQAAGYRTGLYTSPHLLSFRERIRVNGVPLPGEEVVRFVARHHPIIEAIKPSFFEMTVAMAFDYFAREKVDIAVIETGLGGRLDSTNIIHPELAVITNISLDHTEFLGENLSSIAREKGGIIKENVPLVIGNANNEVEEILLGIAGSRTAPVTLAYMLLEHVFSTANLDGTVTFRFKRNTFPTDRKEGPSAEGMVEATCDLAGDYQGENLATVMVSIDILRESGWKIGEDQVREGLSSVVRSTGFIGRWQTIGFSPRSICDAAHNPDAVARVIRQVVNTPWKELHLVWGMVKDKDPEAVLPLLPVEATYYFCSASIPRSMDATLLMNKALPHGLKGDAYPNVEEAYREARRRAGKEDFIFVGGSTFVVADLLETLHI